MLDNHNISSPVLKDVSLSSSSSQQSSDSLVQGTQSLNIGVNFIGTGAAFPKCVLNNNSLSNLVDTSDDWIVSHTGIRERHLASTSENESLPKLAAQAAAKALKAANLTSADLDLIILATSTADDLFGNASVVQAELGATQAVAFDCTVGCSGFIFGLVTGAQFIRTGIYRNVLVIGADTLSRWVNWSDRNTCILFGDGAGAMVMQATLPSQRDQLLGFELYTDGTKNNVLKIPYHGQNKPVGEYISINKGDYDFLEMKGKEVYKFTHKTVPKLIDKMLIKANLTVSQVDWFILHQSNQRILDTIAKKLNIPSEKMLSNIDRYGNTAAASIPLLLDESLSNNKIKPGDLVVVAGYGAGLNFGAAALNWGNHQNEENSYD